jgi:signal transduction histidine kinase
MTLRTRLFVLVGTIVALTVVLVTVTVSAAARRSFAALDAQRTAVLVAQVRREFAVEGEQVAQRLERIAASDAVQRIANDLRRSAGDPAASVGDAAPLAQAQGLDFLDIVTDQGTIVSSAHAPARFGYRHPLLTGETAALDPAGAPFLQRVELPGDAALGMMATRAVAAGDRRVYLIGGRKLDEHFVRALVLPEGMRAVIYRNVEPAVSRRQFVDASGVVVDSGPLEPLVARVRESRQEARDVVREPGGDESMAALPLPGRDGAVLGVLLVGSSSRELSALVSRIRWSGVALGALGIVFGFILSYAVASRVTRPVEELADAARAVARGTWDTRIETAGSGEVGDLAAAFNLMTRQLVDQRDRLVQAERVAAWRELARRLAHELKNPLFPLRLTVDNLRRARCLAAAEFDEVFEESIGTLTSGLESLTAVVGRFSDFARMPVPVFADVDPNEIAQRAVKLFQAQFAGGRRPAITVTLDLDPSIGTIQADGEQLGRALTNLLLNAIDAMPDGGSLTVRTRRVDENVVIAVADTGTGLTEEERSRLFTPYYTTKQHGTGLGLAIVQSVVADHNGTIRVDSTPGGGTTFRIELPPARPGDRA